MKAIDLTNKTFGKLYVVCKSKKKLNNHVYWDCICDCGGRTTISSQKLRTGYTKSCGCLNGRGKGPIKSDESWLENLSGKKFGRLTVLCFTDKMPSGGIRFLCKCDCGKITKVSRQGLIRGTTVSCGCYRLDQLKKQTGKRNPAFKHGMRHHELFEKYHHIIGRCYRHKDKSYKNYGARGIVICRLWKKNISSFFNWAFLNGYKKGLEIDRINNNGPYAPWNCQFLTKKENRKKRHAQKNRYMPN